MYENIVAKDRNGCTPFHFACVRGHLDVVKLFVPLSKSKLLHPDDCVCLGINGRSTCKAAHTPLDINAVAGDGNTGVVWAQRNGHTEVVAYLLSEGADAP